MTDWDLIFLYVQYRKLINKFLCHVEPEAIEKHKHGQFKWRWFWSAGVMEYWSIDQHDKWGRFGLWLHLGIDPYPGWFAWLKIWWCDWNPRLLINYYLEAARKVGGMFPTAWVLIFNRLRWVFLGIPLLTMSDPGSENNGIANMHTLTRHQLDLSLCGTLQHLFCCDKKNIKSEIGWSQFRAQWAPGFEDFFDFGVNSGFYTALDPLEKYAYWVTVDANPLIWNAKVWSFSGLRSHGFRLRLTNGSSHTHTTLALNEPTSTRLYPMAYLTSYMQNLNGLNLRTFRYGIIVSHVAPSLALSIVRSQSLLICLMRWNKNGRRSMTQSFSWHQ